MSVTGHTTSTSSDSMVATIDIRELLRLQSIETAAMRVASSRRDGIVTDQAPLNALDAALEFQWKSNRTNEHSNVSGESP